MNYTEVENIEEIDSPAILLYKEVVLKNIEKMIEIAGDSKRLVPHIKTNKMVNVVKMMISKGLNRFKCATISEAEMAAIAGAESVIIAHQLVGPKLQRWISLIKKYPNTKFSALVDCRTSAQNISDLFLKNDLIANVFFDINSGMDRSGHAINDSIIGDIDFVIACPNVSLLGFHIYDGHIREEAFNLRKQQIEQGFQNLKSIIDFYKNKNQAYEIIAGGTPAFTSHASEIERSLSPGTCVLWDWGYGDRFKEQNFEYAALLLTRVISKPTNGIITVDLGHKAVSSENPIDKRVRFLNLNDYELLSQSEEHGVIKTSEWEKFQVGDVLFGVPYHVCPTINLYDEAFVIESGRYTENWEIIARKRKITI